MTPAIGTVADKTAMIAGMQPSLMDGVYHFCTAANGDKRLANIAAQALATFQEAEGLSLILSHDAATAARFPTDQPMRQITLNVYSSLEGVGLTAAVATALAGAGIACNMVAAFHHDHAFVPADLAETALAVLNDLARSTA